MIISDISEKRIKSIGLRLIRHRSISLGAGVFPKAFDFALPVHFRYRLEFIPIHLLASPLSLHSRHAPPTHRPHHSSIHLPHLIALPHLIVLPHPPPHKSPTASYLYTHRPSYKSSPAPLSTTPPTKIQYPPPPLQTYSTPSPECISISMCAYRSSPPPPHISRCSPSPTRSHLFTPNSVSCI